MLLGAEELRKALNAHKLYRARAQQLPVYADCVLISYLTAAFAAFTNFHCPSSHDQENTFCHSGAFAGNNRHGIPSTAYGIRSSDGICR